MWFVESHEEDANRFLGVINFDNGDALGYIISPDGALGSKLCSFDHESYDGDEEQALEDFLLPQYDSFTAYIEERAG